MAKRITLRTEVIDPDETLHVVRLAAREWSLCDGHGSFLLIPDIGGIATRKSHVVDEARRRMDSDGYTNFNPAEHLTMSDAYALQLISRRMEDNR